MIIRNGVKIVVFNEQQQVLLMKRTDTDDRRPGEWDIPGGGVDNGEDFGQAAARELAEEAGIVVTVSQLKAVYTNTMLYDSGDVSANRMLYVLHVTGAEIVISDEHDEYRWVSLEQAIAEFPHPVYNAGIVYADQQGLL